jgi:hypothetical protein
MQKFSLFPGQTMFSVLHHDDSKRVEEKDTRMKWDGGRRNMAETGG